MQAHHIVTQGQAGQSTEDLKGISTIEKIKNASWYVCEGTTVKRAVSLGSRFRVKP